MNANALKCPTCGAPVNPPQGQAQMVCPYCRAQIALPTPPPAQYGYGGYGPPPPQQHYPQQPFQGPQIVIMGPGVTHVASSAKWALIVPIMVAIIGAGVWFAVQRMTSSAFDAAMGARTWNGASPFSCAGNDSVTATDVTASFTSGTAVEVSGNCHVTLKNVNVKAPVVFDVAGNGHVTMEGGSAEGSQLLVSGSGNGRVEFRGTKTSGKESVSGNARVTR